jgi:hypothetical protein
VNVGGAKKRRCQLCELPWSPPATVDLRGVAFTVVYADDELVGLVGPQVPGALVVPRSHVAGLGDMPGLAGVFLGALRRAVLAVQAVYGTSGAMVEPVASTVDAAGHVAYRVVPTVRWDGERSLAPVSTAAPRTVAARAGAVQEAAAVSEDLAAVLGSRLAPR